MEGTDHPVPPPVDAGKLRGREPRTSIDYFFLETPEGMAHRVKAYTDGAPVETVWFWASLGGMSEERARTHVHLVCNELAPLLAGQSHQTRGRRGMTGRLDGRVALVTGAGQGIGRGTALALAKEGACVALAGRTVSKCEAVAAEIADLGGTALPVECDVSVRAQVDAAVAATVSAFGGIDILVNNAQTSVQATLEDTTVRGHRAGLATRVPWRRSTRCSPPFHTCALGGRGIDRQLRIEHRNRGQRRVRGLRDGERGDPWALASRIP